MLVTKRKTFIKTADDTNILSGDTELGQLGKGKWRVWAAADDSDATITIKDEKGVILNAAPIPVGQAGADGYPIFRRNEWLFWEFTYGGAEAAPVIDVTDGTDANIALVVEYGV